MGVGVISRGEGIMIEVILDVRLKDFQHVWVLMVGTFLITKFSLIQSPVLFWIGMGLLWVGALILARHEYQLLKGTMPEGEGL